MKRLLIIALIASILFSSCTKESKDVTTGKTAQIALPTQTSSPTEPVTPTPAAVPNDEVKEVIPPEPFDADGRAVAVYGTPAVDGAIDDVWKTAASITPSVVSSSDVKVSGEFRVLWDDNAIYTLYIVKDTDLNKSGSNTYEQDSVEIFLDELNDKSSSYQNDDVHYRVNYDNETSVDSGDPGRFYTAAGSLLNDAGNVIGYIVEASIAWTAKPSNDVIMGFDLQINEADSAGKRLGTINIFDKSGSAWSNPSRMGEIILKGKAYDLTAKVSPNVLSSYIKYVEGIHTKVYVNSDILTEPLKNAKELLANPIATQKEYDDAVEKLRTAVNLLDDGSGYTKVSKLTPNVSLPDPFTFFNGDKIASADDWPRRAQEISQLYQYYMYGVVPDTSDEKVSYSISGNTMNITVEKDGRKVTFPVDFTLPGKNVKKPEGGYPVIIAYLFLTQSDYANKHGYATITLNTQFIASDDSTRSGIFYELYPYGESWKDQTGALLAWSWGVSKIIDALEAGADAQLGINTKNTILTGVSRWGKSTLAAGAFDKRIRVTAPSCSGAGGVACFRYKTAGKTYDYSDIGVKDPYVMTANEQIGNLQASGESHWFNDNFLQFKDETCLPFDQHLLASLCAEKDRYLFITCSYLNEDWTNPPAMWLTYLAARDVYDYLGLSDNIAMHIHKEGHKVTDGDMVYLIDFCDYHFYGKKVKSDLKDLTTSLFMNVKNYDPLFDLYVK